MPFCILGFSVIFGLVVFGITSPHIFLVELSWNWHFTITWSVIRQSITFSHLILMSQIGFFFWFSYLLWFVCTFFGRGRFLFSWRRYLLPWRYLFGRRRLFFGRFLLKSYVMFFRFCFRRRNFLFLIFLWRLDWLWVIRIPFWFIFSHICVWLKSSFNLFFAFPVFLFVNFFCFRISFFLCLPIFFARLFWFGNIFLWLIRFAFSLFSFRSFHRYFWLLFSLILFEPFINIKILIVYFLELILPRFLLCLWSDCFCFLVRPSRLRFIIKHLHNFLPLLLFFPFLFLSLASLLTFQSTHELHFALNLCKKDNHIFSYGMSFVGKKPISLSIDFGSVFTSKILQSDPLIRSKNHSMPLRYLRSINVNGRFGWGTAYNIIPKVKGNLCFQFRRRKNDQKARSGSLVFHIN